MIDKTDKGIRSKRTQEKLRASEVRYRRLFGREKKSKLGDVKSFSHVGGFLSCRKPSVLKWLSRFGHAVGLISRPNSRFSPLHELLLPFRTRVPLQLVSSTDESRCGCYKLDKPTTPPSPPCLTRAR